MGNSLSYCDASGATETQPEETATEEAAPEDTGETEEEQTEEPEEEAEEEAPRTYPKKPKVQRHLQKSLEVKCVVQFWSPPPDPRFRSVNQARTCYTRYNEFYKSNVISCFNVSDGLVRCKLEKDEDSEECKFYKRCYESICPDEWVNCFIL